MERHDPIKIFIITQTVAGGYLLETTVAIIIMNQPKSQKAQKERRHKHTHTHKNYPEQQKSVPSVRHHTMGRIVVVQAKANCDFWKVNHIKRFSSLFFACQVVWIFSYNIRKNLFQTFMFRCFCRLTNDGSVLFGPQ